MARRGPAGLLVGLILVLAGCGGGGDERRDVATTPNGGTIRGDVVPPPTTTPRRPAPTTPIPPTDPADPYSVPEGVPTTPGGKADLRALAVVERWLAALTQGDIPAAADTFASGAIVKNFGPAVRLRTRSERIGFNALFPCGAEIVEATTRRGYLLVTYRLTDRRGSPCDGPGGSAAGVIKVEADRMTEWYRLPDPGTDSEEEPGPVL